MDVDADKLDIRNWYAATSDSFVASPPIARSDGFVFVDGTIGDALLYQYKYGNTYVDGVVVSAECDGLGGRDVVHIKIPGQNSGTSAAVWTTITSTPAQCRSNSPTLLSNMLAEQLASPRYGFAHHFCRNQTPSLQSPKYGNCTEHNWTVPPLDIPWSCGFNFSNVINCAPGQRYLNDVTLFPKCPNAAGVIMDI